jgi:hypothetical protein
MTNANSDVESIMWRRADETTIESGLTAKAFGLAWLVI